MQGQASKYIQEGKYIYLFFTFLLLVNIFVYLVAIKPRWSEADALRKEYLTLRADESRLREEKHEKIRLAEDVRQARLDLKDFISELAPDTVISKIRSDIYRAAKRSSISISSAKYSLPEYKYDDIVKYGISFPVSGQYRRVRRFIYALEKMPYLMSINDLAIRSEKEGNVVVDIMISIYLKAGEE